MSKTSDKKKSNQAYGMTPSGLIIPGYQIPKQQQRPANYDEHESAGAMLARLAQTIMEWRDALPEDAQPVITAIASGGVQIVVERLSQESFHGVRIEGLMNGSPCMLLAHQANLELLCFIEKVESVEFRRKIGFIIDGEEQEV